MILKAKIIIHRVLCCTKLCTLLYQTVSPWVLGPTAGRESGDEGPPVLGRHEVVDDGVDGGAEVEKDAIDVVEFLVDSHEGVFHAQEEAEQRVFRC